MKRIPKLSLKALRIGLGVTQLQVAKKAKMNQSDISRLENRDDVKISTLRKYIEALGGTLEIQVKFDSGHQFIIDL